MLLKRVSNSVALINVLRPSAPSSMDMGLEIGAILVNSQGLGHQLRILRPLLSSLLVVLALYATFIRLGRLATSK